MIRLGVNIDHVATLRQVRLARYPDIVEAMHLCERGGADQITVHLREDRRHIQDQDVHRLLESSLLPVNLEMAFTPAMLRFAIRTKPFSVTLVPERREEMTTERGLDLRRLRSKISSLRRLQKTTRVFGFIDADRTQVKTASELALDGVEFHTGSYAEYFEQALRARKGEKALANEVKRLFDAAETAVDLDLEVRAGHGLTIQNVKSLRAMPGLQEMNIGHSIVARAVLMGLEAATREMKNAMNFISV